MNRLRRLAFPTFLLAGAFAAPSACVEAGNGAPPPGYEVEGSGGSSTAGTSPGGSGGSGPVGGSGGSGGSGPVGGSGGSGGSGPVGGSGGSSGSGPDPFASGAELRVTVNALGRSFVHLDPLSLVTPAAPAASNEWDLAFEGYDVFTNGGASGVSAGSAFGPFAPADFASTVAPEFPFFIDDKTGGPFLSWYKYDGAGGHVLWPRYHVYGVKDGESYWKVQITSYYSERDNFPTAALYAVRYASIGPGGPGATQEVVVDGTSPSTAANDCLDLGTGGTSRLTPEEALASTAWHLCFRRDNVNVNGELGGPRGTLAVDFDAAATEGETLEQIKAIQPAEGLARFNALTFDHFASATLRGDRIVSAFDGAWADLTLSPPAPTATSWLVRGADGASTYFVGFAAFEAATAASPGTVVLRAKRLGP